MTLCVGLTQGGRDITMVRYSNGHLRQHRGRRKLGSEAHYASRRAVRFHAPAAASTQGSYRFDNDYTDERRDDAFKSDARSDAQVSPEHASRLADIPLVCLSMLCILDKFSRVGQE